MKVGTFGPTKRQAYLDKLREGLGRCAAARAVGVDPDTPAIHRRKYPEFAVACEQAELEACEQVEDALYQAALSGNVVACQVWLYNRAPERWRDKRNVEASVSHGGRIEHTELDEDGILAAAEVIARRRELEQAPTQ